MLFVRIFQETLLFLPRKLPHRRKVVNLVVFHSALDFVFEIAPREIREFQIVRENTLERLVAEHYRLRQRHIRDCRRFLFAHCAARQKHDRARVDKSAVFHFVVPQYVVSAVFSPFIKQDQAEDHPRPHGDK